MAATFTGANRMQGIWSRLTSADRVVLLGHDRDELTSDELTRLARVAQAVRITRDNPPARTRRTGQRRRVRVG